MEEKTVKGFCVKSRYRMDLIPDMKVRNWAKGGIIRCSLYMCTCWVDPFTYDIITISSYILLSTQIRYEQGVSCFLILAVLSFSKQTIIAYNLYATIIFVLVFSMRSDDTVRIRPRREVPWISWLKLYFCLSKHHSVMIRISDSIRLAFWLSVRT